MAASMAVPEDLKKPLRKAPYPFYLGGLAACCAATITHPLDLTKYRLQTATVKRGMFATMISSVREEGVKSLFHGLTATWLRQASYSITRFAAYEKAKDVFTEGGTKKATTGQLFLCSGGAGFVAGIVGVPAEVVLVRMCSDLNRPMAQRYGYSNALAGLGHIAKEEGAKVLFRGLAPNVTRSVVLNAGQMGGYDLFKDLLLKLNVLPDGPMLQTAATFCAGTLCTALVTPIDVVKSRIQNARGADATLGIMGTITKSFKNDGPTVFFRGFTPAFIRLQPQTTLLFLFFERFKKMVDESRAKKEQALA